MTAPEAQPGRWHSVLVFFGTPRFSAALSTAIIGAAFFSFLLKNLIGWAGLFAILSGLVVLAGASFLGQREEIEWRGLLPISLLAFVGWSGFSVFLSQYQWSTLGGVVYQLAFAALGVYVALARDFIQIVRITGNVLRYVLTVSLAVEVLSGLLIDTPIHFLGIQGNLDVGGPIQGVLGTRNQLGLVSLIALVTFGTELLTRSVSRQAGILSLILASLSILLSQSPVNLGVLGVLGLASLGLLGLRRVTAESRRYWLLGLGTAALAAIIATYIFRARVLHLLGATGDFDYRLRLWNSVLPFIQQNPIEGWGWVGSWPSDIFPFEAIDPTTDHLSALNAYLDVWFQLGLVGLFAFLGLVGLALVRSWILATQKRSRVFVWPALLLVALLTTGLAESGVLVEWGWLILVVCVVKVAQHLSWRQALQSGPG